MLTSTTTTGATAIPTTSRCTGWACVRPSSRARLGSTRHDQPRPPAPRLAGLRRAGRGGRRRDARPGGGPGVRQTRGEITTEVDVRGYADHKRRAMRAHASQISEQSFFLALPHEAFEHAFGTEWFIREGQGPGITETDLFAGL